MKRLLSFAIALHTFTATTHAQSNFNYTVHLHPVNIPGAPGLHSFAFGQHGGKWLLVGGRKDGIHARQPFNAFPQAQNNDSLYVLDVASQQVWSAPLSTLSTPVQEQLQATNMNFAQVADTLYIAGGYAFSPTANDYITFPRLTTVVVPELISAIINGASISNHISQITDTVFAVTGGRMGYNKGRFMLVGGQKFTGRYNPMGGGSYVQQYTNQIRRFHINNSGAIPVISGYSVETDPVHLRRRDYNLIPQIFANGEQGFTISSGVFQPVTDLPYLYPVNIKDTGYTPVTSFNQYLSHYHSAFASIFDSAANEMHTIFFGGISQYHFLNGTLQQDANVPFVKTISRLSRLAAGGFQEYQMGTDMPGLQGAGAEFIANTDLPHIYPDILKLGSQTSDTLLLGHIYGGISSPTANPFVNNQTNSTSAMSVAYEVRLIKSNAASVQKIDGANPYEVRLYPNPASRHVYLEFHSKSRQQVPYFITDASGRVLEEGNLREIQPGVNRKRLALPVTAGMQAVFVTFVFDGVFFVSRQLSITRP